MGPSKLPSKRPLFPRVHVTTHWTRITSSKSPTYDTHNDKSTAESRKHTEQGQNRNIKLNPPKKSTHPHLSHHDPNPPTIFVILTLKRPPRTDPYPNADSDAPPLTRPMEIAPAPPPPADRDVPGDAASTDAVKTSSSSKENEANAAATTSSSSVAVKYDEEEEEEDVCRICRNPGDADNPLRYPCACSGSIKFVHQDCLLQWLNHSNARQCEVQLFLSLSLSVIGFCGIFCVSVLISDELVFAIPQFLRGWN